MTAEEIATRARAVADQLHTAGWRVTLTSGASAVGGGSAPGVTLPTVLVALERDGISAAAIEQRLRATDPPIIARIEDDRVVLDLRTVLEAQDALLLRAFVDFSAGVDE